MTKIEKCRKFLELVKTRRTITNLFQQLREALPDWEEDTPHPFDRLLEDLDEFMELNAELYERVVTEEELDAVITFYDSPAGKSWLSKSPELQRLGMEMGQNWSQEKMKTIIEELEQDDSPKPKRKIFLNAARQLQF